MTDLRKAAEMALEALMDANKFEYKDEIAALRQALAQPEQKLIGWKDGEPQYIEQPEQEPFKPDWVSYRQGVADGAAQPEQEPVAYMGSAGLGYDKNKYLSIPLYTAPPRKEWVGLTEDEIHGIIDVCTPDEAAQDELNDFAKAIFAAQAKLKEKNNAV